MSAPAARDQSWETTGRTGGVRWPIAAVAALALTVLAAAILISLLHLRRHIFAQIANRDGEILNALAAQQFLDDKARDESITNLEDTGEQMQLVFEISQKLTNVIGVRIFSPEGKYVIAVPTQITEGSLAQKDLETLSLGGQLSHFYPHVLPEEFDVLADAKSPRVPILEINLALGEEGKQHVAGIAQFLINGSSIAREYDLIDNELMAQAALTFAICGAIVTAGLILAFRRVRKANVLLAERTDNLLKANRELALAAKTSAIGAVTSHLIHGLKNPLSGLTNFVQERATGEESGPDSDWQLAIASTQRMQMLIDRVVGVLQEQQMVTEYQVSFAELLEMITSRVRPVAQTAGVKFASSLSTEGAVSNREADLILLILENLVQNAIEATPAGKGVHLTFSSEGARTIVDVRDEGTGLSPELAEELFTPSASTKKGGSGIGLTISRQLAVHMGAVLELKQTSASGCCFRLTLPSHDSRDVAKDHPGMAADGDRVNSRTADEVFAEPNRKRQA